MAVTCYPNWAGAARGWTWFRGGSRLHDVETGALLASSNRPLFVVPRLGLFSPDEALWESLHDLGELSAPYRDAHVRATLDVLHQHPEYTLHRWERIDPTTRDAAPSNVVWIEPHPLDATAPARQTLVVLYLPDPPVPGRVDALIVAPTGTCLGVYEDVDLQGGRAVQQVGAFGLLRTRRPGGTKQDHLLGPGFQLLEAPADPIVIGELATGGRCLMRRAPGTSPEDDLWHLLQPDGRFGSPPGTVGLRPASRFWPLVPLNELEREAKLQEHMYRWDYAAQRDPGRFWARAAVNRRMRGGYRHVDIWLARFGAEAPHAWGDTTCTLSFPPVPYADEAGMFLPPTADRDLANGEGLTFRRQHREHAFDRPYLVTGRADRWWAFSAPYYGKERVVFEGKSADEVHAKMAAWCAKGFEARQAALDARQKAFADAARRREEAEAERRRLEKELDELIEAGLRDKDLRKLEAAMARLQRGDPRCQAVWHTAAWLTADTSVMARALFEYPYDHRDRTGLLQRWEGAILARKDEHEITSAADRAKRNYVDREVTALMNHAAAIEGRWRQEAAVERRRSEERAAAIQAQETWARAYGGASGGGSGYSSGSGSSYTPSQQQQDYQYRQSLDRAIAGSTGSSWSAYTATH